MISFFLKLFFKIILTIISNVSIWSIEATLTNTTTPGQSRPESIDNEEVTPHSPKLQNLNLTTECSL